MKSMAVINVFAAEKSTFFAKNRFKEGLGLGVFDGFHGYMVWFFDDLIVESANWTEDYFEV